MKFELEPDNRGADDGTLLNNLREVAALLGKDYVTKSVPRVGGLGIITILLKTTMFNLI